MVVMCVAVGLISCSASSKVDAGAEPVLLRVGERTFTVADVSRLISEQPEVLQSKYSTEAGKKEFVEGLTRTELLLAEARRRGLEKDTSVRSLVERLLVQKLAEQTTPNAPTESELKKAYDDAQSEFVKPDRLHLRAVFLAAPLGDANREKVKKEAAAAHALLLAAKPTEREARFEVLARQRSDLLAWRDAGGDLGPRTTADLVALLGLGVQKGAADLQQPGTMTEVLETERGFVMLYLRGRQPGLTQSFESVKPRLAQRLVAEGRARALEELVSALKKNSSVSVNETLLKALRTSANRPLISGTDGG